MRRSLAALTIFVSTESLIANTSYLESPEPITIALEKPQVSAAGRR
jgi:hypothetical protein